MRKKILNNWTLKLASLVLAIVIWFLVVQIEDPPDTKTFSNIQVKLINTELLERENKVYEILDNTNIASVTVRAPKSVFGYLRASDIVAVADVSKITDINTIAIDYSIQNVEGWESIEGNHDVVRLSVEDKSVRWIDVVHSTVGEVAENYMIASAEPDQTQIEISGPKSVVERVRYAGVEIDVEGATNDRSANVDITLYDSEGNVVEQDNIKKNVSYVHMDVEVLATKEIPVEIHYMGIPAEGYTATGVVSSEPDMIRIAGSTYALSRISKITIPEDRLNITGASSDMADIIDIRDYLPSNVQLADREFNGKITATVYVEPIIEETLQIPIANIAINNVPEGMNALLPEGIEYYELKVSGLAAVIEPLDGAQVVGTVDVQAWMEAQGMTELLPGGYAIPVTFLLSEEVDAEKIIVWIDIQEVL
uniref:CdaR family protein n=1 Tax=Acetatifactor sp. TaxID=1872090 RepID=UPI0040565627